MSPAHFQELEQKHQALEQQIQDEMSHPHADSLRVAELKRRKLQLKDEMVRIQATTHETVH